MDWGAEDDGRNPPIVGRAAEQAVLDAALRSLAGGRARVVLVDGPAGAGKTTLAAYAARSVPRSLTVLWGRGHELDPDRPLGVLREALAGRAEVPWPGVTDVSLLHGGSSAGAYGVQETVLDALEQLAVAGPVLVVLEDLHWADPATLHTVGVAVGRLARLPFGLVATRRALPRRPDVGTLWDSLAAGGATRLLLEPLDADAVAQLAAAVLGVPPGPDLRRELARAGGSPLLVLELLRALRDDGAVGRVAGTVELIGAPLVAPAGSVVQRQLRALDDDTAALLRAAAVLGTAFVVDDLAVVTAALTTAMLPRLDHALAAGLLVEDGDRLAFRHALVRDAVYDELPPSTRRALHLQAARRLAAAGRPAEVVAAHYRLGALPGDIEAASWLRRAGRHAVGSAPAIAADLLDEALHLLPRGHDERDELLAELGVAQVWSGRPAAAAATLGRLLARPHAAGVDAPVRLARARALILTGRTDEARRLLAGAAGRTGVGHRDRGLILAELALAHLLAADLDDAATAAAAALAAADAGGGGAAASLAHGALSAVAQLRGDLPEARRLADVACQLAATADDPEASRRPPQLFAGMHAVNDDRFDEGLALLRQAREVSEEFGGIWDLPLCHWFTAVLRFHSGALDDADAEVEAGLIVAAEAGTALSAVWAQAVRAHVALHRGDLPAVRAALQVGEGELAERGPLVRGADWLLWARALLLEREGDPTAATALLGAVWDGHAARGIVAERCLIGPDLVRLAVATGHRARVDAVVAGTAEAAERAGCRSSRGAALRARALASGDPAIGAAAVGAYAGSGRRLECALAAEEAAGLHRAAGDTITARALLGGAIDAYEACGATSDLRRAAAALRSTGVRRGARGPRRRPTLGWEALTDSEREVVDLAVTGLTNREIGRRLFVSPRTVETHLSHVYSKLSVTSRVELAGAAARRDPGSPVH